MKKKKIVFFNPLVTTGGISKIIADYSKNLKDYNIEILCLKIINNLYLIDSNIKIVEIGTSKNIFKRLKKEISYLKNTKPDIFHINGDFSNRIIECIAGRLSKVEKIIIHSHSTGALKLTWFKKIVHILSKKMFDKLADEYLACSDEAAKWLFSRTICKNKQYIVIKNGISINNFIYNQSARNRLRKSMNLVDKNVIGYVGRLSYEKNPMFLLELLEKLINQKQNVHLLIIGTGPMKKKINLELKKMQLENRCTIIDQTKNINDFYSCMDCFVLPSLYEGFGIVNIESQCSGLKTICSNNVPETAKITDYIFFLPLTNIDEWINRIEENIPINRRIAYKNVITAGYSLDDVMHELEEIYRR